MPQSTRNTISSLFAGTIEVTHKDMRIPFVDKLLLLLRPRIEDDFERIMLMHDLGKRGTRVASWTRFGLVAMVTLFLAGAQSRVDDDLQCLAQTG